MELTGKSALITGGTGALGGAIAEAFLAAGASVASTVRDEAEAARAKSSSNPSVRLIPADVTKEKDVAALFDRAIMLLGRIDILVNVVGGYAGGSPVRDMAAEEWDGMMGLNLRSVFLCSREYLRRSAGAPFGRIVSIGAMPALRPAANRAAYAVSKAGVISLTQMLGAELKGSGVTANSIAPSVIDTAANRASMPGEDWSRWVRPGDIAGQIVFLCSEKASSINGVCIPMFGGI
jgi:NAD(P)-dependent dehydrogenase (short-subunit alcohol dehydrogenase family)